MLRSYREMLLQGMQLVRVELTTYCTRSRTTSRSPSPAQISVKSRRISPRRMLPAATTALLRKPQTCDVKCNGGYYNNKEFKEAKVKVMLASGRARKSAMMQARQ